MSLAINPELITRVLLADGWHNIRAGSFDLDAYEFIERHEEGKTFSIFSGGQDPQVPSTGFTFTTNVGEHISGPITSILAVSY